MPEAFSFNREFDFVRLDGLRRATGRSPHEWDLYIVKELVDNALDADDTLWASDIKQLPRLHIGMEYTIVPGRQLLSIYVSNRARFPVDQIEDIFSTQWYTSHKAFIKGLTRGALGNALKTLLGIPYALRNRGAEDWKPDLKPLSILCNGIEYLPRYIVDSTTQNVNLRIETRKGKSSEGTKISIGLDYFIQEMPRTLAEIELLAQQYHLCNPHAQFHWHVEIGKQVWAKEFIPDPNWASKYRGVAPVQWYSLTAFQDLLGALHRKQSGGKEMYALSLETVCSSFAKFNGQIVGHNSSINSFGQKKLAASDIESPLATKLYQVLFQHSNRFDSAQLGCIGQEHVRTVLTLALPVEGDILYEIAPDNGSDPNIPFVIEVAVARLKEGKRQIWTAINFSPTYEDPFINRSLQAPAQPTELVLGLRGLMDIYGFRNETPVVLFLHLICPNIEFHEFSKTGINHLPFKWVLGDVLDRLLMAFARTCEEEELRLEQAVLQELEGILKELERNERFVLDQLLERLRVRLCQSQNQKLVAWLQKPEATGRLQAYIVNYQSRNPLLTQYVARPSMEMLDIPSHPNRHFSVLLEYISHDLLVNHNVNKVLYIRPRDLEPVIIENGWLCLMDMALLRNPPSFDRLAEALMQCAVGSSLPILVLHDADEEGCVLVGQMRTWLDKRHIKGMIMDLGLSTPIESSQGKQPRKLVEMMPGELAEYLLRSFDELGIPRKSLPPDADIRKNISERVEQLLRAYLLEGMLHKFEMMNLLIKIDEQIGLTKAIMNQALDEQLKRRLHRELGPESYTMVLDKVAKEFFERFLSSNEEKVRKLVQEHIL